MFILKTIFFTHGQGHFLSLFLSLISHLKFLIMYINTQKDSLIKFHFLLAHISIQIVLMQMLARVRELEWMCAAIKACSCHSLNVQIYLILSV